MNRTTTPEDLELLRNIPDQSIPDRSSSKRRLIKIRKFIDSINNYKKLEIESMLNFGFPESEIQKVKDEYDEIIRLSLMLLRIDDDGYIIVDSRTED